MKVRRNGQFGAASSAGQRVAEPTQVRTARRELNIRPVPIESHDYAF